MAARGRSRQKAESAVISVVVAAAALAGSSAALPIEPYYRHTIDIRFEDLLADEAYGLWIRENLGCSRSTFLSLSRLLCSSLIRVELSKYSKQHTAPAKIAMLLYFLRTQGGSRETASAFGTARSWVFEIVDALIEALASVAGRFVYFPKTQDQWRTIEAGFEAMQGFPGVVGAIDGTLIEIPRPHDYDGFYCRHMNTALNVQAVVDNRGRFMSIDVRPNSWSDKKIWRQSRLGRSVHSVIPPGRHLRGGAGYTLLPYLLTPYVERECGGALTRRQRRYNYVHSATRMTVESAFGQLKGRFRSLLVSLDHKSSSKQARHIAACVVLHNILKDLADNNVVSDVMEENDEIGDDVRDDCTAQDSFTRQLGATKRYSIATLLDDATQ